MADIWIPGFERWPIDGKPGLIYDESDDPKACAHTTEGTSIEGAVSAYKAYPPQLIVDPNKKRKVQHIPVNRGGYALWNEDADDSRCIQVEIVGFARWMPEQSDEWLRWLGEEVARPLHEHAGVPYRVVWKGFKGPEDVDYILASPSSPLRLTQYELDTFSGWLGHQHIPGDSHWDPGGLDVQKILNFAQEGAVDYTPNDRERDNHHAWRTHAIANVISPTKSDPTAPNPPEPVEAAIILNRTKHILNDLMHLNEVGKYDRVKDEKWELVTAFLGLVEDVETIGASVQANAEALARIEAHLGTTPPDPV